jgi:hypothetical protein
MWRADWKAGTKYKHNPSSSGIYVRKCDLKNCTFAYKKERQKHMEGF